MPTEKLHEEKLKTENRKEITESQDDFSEFYNQERGSSAKVQVISFESEPSEKAASEPNENYLDLFYNDDEESETEMEEKENSKKQQASLALAKSPSHLLPTSRTD